VQKIVLDTNVLISSIISEGIPANIIKELVLENKVILCISDSVLHEYSNVLKRDKFLKYKNFKTEADLLIEKIQYIAQRFEPNISLNLLTDKSDNKFLELSIFANTDFLITGNTNDFTEKKYQDVNVVTPREYWDEHKPE
jgi:putative PIN family toxin of toxin-antitoxin system